MTEADCEHCACLSVKTRRRRLARQASLSNADPRVGVTNPPATRVGEELPGTHHPHGGEVMDDDSESGDKAISLGSDEEYNNEPFILSPAAKPATEGDVCDLHDVCKTVAAKLGIAWPETSSETTTSRYEEKRLPKVKSSARQLLPVFPECLEEVTLSWRNPLIAKIPVQGGLALDWVERKVSPTCLRLNRCWLPTSTPPKGPP